jgi:hypothetical protein
MRFRVLAAAALAAVPLAVLPAPAQAAVRPATSCYGFNYSYSINSVHIQATATEACPGSTIPPYMVIERLVNGNYSFITSTTSGFISYTCSGKATPTGYEIGPIFTVGVPSYTWYQFTDNCG